MGLAGLLYGVFYSHTSLLTNWFQRPKKYLHKLKYFNSLFLIPIFCIDYFGVTITTIPDGTTFWRNYLFGSLMWDTLLYAVNVFLLPLVKREADLVNKQNRSTWEI